MSIAEGTVQRKSFDTIVIGGGQTGLVVGYELSQRGQDFVILDANERVGDAWRNRWDSLRLFTPVRMNGLPGMKFPGRRNDFVHKDDVADFLEQYARVMELPVRNGVRVTRLSRDGDDFLVETTAGPMRAHSAVVAMADYQKPSVPAFASELDPATVQLHSSEYKNTGQLQPGPVLVVGMGNSGADIALDVAADHPTTIAGKESAAIPFKLESWFGRNIGTRLVRFGAIDVLTTSTPIGRRARPKMLSKSAPLVRVRPKELKAGGVGHVGRITGVESGKPVADDGTVLDVTNVIWATGYRKGFDWIDVPFPDEGGRPQTERGVVADQPGLYFVGLFFLHALWSETIPGVQRDARYVADHLVRNRAPAAAAV